MAITLSSSARLDLLYQRREEEGEVKAAVALSFTPPVCDMDMAFKPAHIKATRSQQTGATALLLRLQVTQH